jgi:hypothetical protein
MANIIEKRHVRLYNGVVTAFDADGNPVIDHHEAHDYVPVDILPAYLADARTRWAVVEVVADTHDAGPGGDDGWTHYPHHLSAGHPHQGKTVNRHGEYKED